MEPIILGILLFVTSIIWVPIAMVCILFIVIFFLFIWTLIFEIFKEMIKAIVGLFVK